MRNPKKIFIFSAPSGAGKTSLTRSLIKSIPGLFLSVSSTTRPKRDKEAHGEHYFFCSMEEFDEKIRQNAFAEWELVHGNKYGTEKSYLDAAIKSDGAVILDIDVKGAMAIAKLYPNDSVSFFINTRNVETLEQRLRARGTESEEKIKNRLDRIDLELSFIRTFDHEIINESFEQAHIELQNLIEYYLCRKP